MPTDVPIRVLFVCLGNVCRSPLAEGLFAARVAREHDGHRFTVDSAGTSGHHAGEAPDPGSIAVARRHGVDISAQRSRKVRPDDLHAFDFIVAMDRANESNLRRIADPGADRLFRIRRFDPAPGEPDVPDPWGGTHRDFDDVRAILDRCVPGLLEHIRRVGPRTGRTGY